MKGLELCLRMSGLQQKDLAERLDIKKQNITYWLKEEHKIPEKYLPILAEMFDRSEDFLLSDIGRIKTVVTDTGMTINF